MDEHDVSEEEAREQTLLTSAPAGKSEHHSGLCVDLVESRAAQRELDETFEDTEAFAWLSQNAHKYGFILRYPKDKTDITKYSYEPWHYRFVGVYAATIIYEDNITLEEYLADFE
jgi:D-alanyl-D-alanine carboxypeptidase